MTTDDVLTWAVSMEEAVKRRRFESPAWEFFTGWWAALMCEYDKRETRRWKKKARAS